MATVPHWIISYYLVFNSLLVQAVANCVCSQISGIDVNSWRDCGDSHCLCHERVAICGKELHYIPKLPTEITDLHFVQSYLPHINASIFKNISTLKVRLLTLNENSVFSLDKNSFNSLHFLKDLYFDNNPNIGVNAVAEAFSSLNKSVIDRLYLRKMGWNDIPNNMFHYLNNSSLRLMDLSRNNMHTVKMKTFSYLKHLSIICLNYNKLKSIEMSMLERLEVLCMDNNQLSQIPDFCDPNSELSFVPQLLDLHLSGNMIKELKQGSFTCLPKLTSLYLDNSGILCLRKNFLSTLPSLKTFHFSNNKLEKIEQLAFNSSTILILYFKGNYLSDSVFHNLEYIFSNCPQLRKICLSNIKFRISKEQINLLLYPLEQLRELDLSTNKLETIPEVISKMTSLEILDLHNNEISSWNGAKSFGKLSKISSLSLYDNQISVINETSFPSSVLKSINQGSLELWHNPYYCTCETLRSVNWIRKHAKLLSLYPKDFECSSPPDVKGTRLENYNPSEESCAEKNIVLLVSIPVSVASIATLTAIFLVYKCRWRLRYGFYLFRNRYKSYERVEDSDNFVFAGFVIYSDADRGWVHNELLHKIEDQEGFRLCIRLRDFEVGKVHVDNIVDNMFLSEKIIVVLSNNFAEDEWCHFQLLLAETKLLKQNIDVLVLLMLEEIRGDCLRPSLYKLVTDGQYALWSDDETGNSLFWEQVVSQLQKSNVIN